jgi:hypothetical protein
VEHAGADVTTYFMNEAAFELPAIGLVDRTVTRLDAVSEDGLAQTIVVHRSRVPEGKSLAELVAESLREAGARLRLHAALFQREIAVDGEPALEVGAQWRGEEGMIYTRQVHLALGDAWIVLAGNCALEGRERCDATFDHILATFRVRE